MKTINKVSHPTTRKLLVEVNGLNFAPCIFECLHELADNNGMSVHAYLHKLAKKHAIENNKEIFGEYVEHPSTKEIKQANGTWIEEDKPKEQH